MGMSGNQDLDEEEIAGGDDDEPVPLENAQEGGEGDAGEVTLLV